VLNDVLPNIKQFVASKVPEAAPRPRAEVISDVAAVDSGDVDMEGPSETTSASDTPAAPVPSSLSTSTPATESTHVVESQDDHPSALPTTRPQDGPDSVPSGAPEVLSNEPNPLSRGLTPAALASVEPSQNVPIAPVDTPADLDRST
jgi:hypothetical protein